MKRKSEIAAIDRLDAVSAKVRCLADIIICLDHDELWMSAYGMSVLCGFLEHIYDEIRAAGMALREV